MNKVNIELETQLSEQREQLENTLAQINKPLKKIELSEEETEETKEAEVRKMVSLGHKLLEFQERFEEIIVRLDNEIKTNREEQEKIKNILDDVKRRKRFKRFFLSNFKGISILCMFLAKLFVSCMTTIDLSTFLLNVIAYMGIILTIEFVNKEDFNQMLLARFIPEYVCFTNDSLAIEKKIEKILEYRREYERLIKLIETEKPTINAYEAQLKWIERFSQIKAMSAKLDDIITRKDKSALMPLLDDFTRDTKKHPNEDYVSAETPKTKTIGTMLKPKADA